MKRSVSIVALSIALTSLLPSPVFAQDAPAAGGERTRRTPEERVKWMRDQLGINDEQAGKVRAVYERSQEKTKALREDKALSEDDRRAKLREIFTASTEEISGILTPEQQAKWRDEMAKRREKGGGARATGPAAEAEKK